MILRIFATDGFTPERIFRWSVEETAAHLCEQQLLWVTRLDGPWQPLVEWFLKQPCCRGVTLDPADRWEWNREHEVTWRLAQGLYFGTETPDLKGQASLPEAVCWIHDDMAPPESVHFKAFLQGWLASKAEAMEAPCYQLWNNDVQVGANNAPLVTNQVRADKVGIDFAADLHCWLAKWSSHLSWIRAKNLPRPGEAPDRFRPLGAIPSVSPYPFRHAKGVSRDFREHKGFVRRGFPTERWKNADGVKCVPYNPEATWEDFKREVGL